MRILNIHGFDGSSENTNYKILRLLGHNVISTQLDYRSLSPNQIYNSKLYPIAKHQDIDLIVATSFGAFFGNRLSAEFNIPCIFTNPCLRPDISLRAIAPEYFSCKNSKEITDWRIDQLSNKQYNYTNKTILIGTADEIIDHDSITTKEAVGAIFYRIEGGKHQLSENQIKDIIEEVIESYEESII